MERGIQYYQWDMIEKSVLEFKFVIHNLSSQNKKLNYSQIRLKSRAHHNLAVAYAKNSWYDDAAVEAREAFELFPSDDNIALCPISLLLPPNVFCQTFPPDKVVLTTNISCLLP